MFPRLGQLSIAKTAPQGEVGALLQLDNSASPTDVFKLRSGLLLTNSFADVFRLLPIQNVPYK